MRCINRIVISMQALLIIPWTISRKVHYTMKRFGYPAVNFCSQADYNFNDMSSQLILRRSSLACLLVTPLKQFIYKVKLTTYYMLKNIFLSNFTAQHEQTRRSRTALASMTVRHLSCSQFFSLFVS